MFLIEFLPNICRPKVQNKYTPSYYSINVDGRVFDFDFYGKPVFLSKHIWENSQRDDLIPFNKDLPNHYHAVARPSHYRFRTSTHVQYHPPIEPPQYHSPISHNKQYFIQYPPIHFTMDYFSLIPKTICTN